jgi:ribulose-phosphate 3-epimerase
LAKEFIVAPSLLSADFANLADEIKALELAGADWLHIDVMDGHFVPNLTIGAPVVKALRKVTKLPLDVHLMIENPEYYLESYKKAGADYVTVHIEAVKSPADALKQIRSLKMNAGITLKPSTPIELILPYLELADLVLVMTVNPGFGGQEFMDEQVTKIINLKEEIEKQKLKTLIEVDGGINDITAKKCRAADVLVAGSFVFSRDYNKAIDELKNAKAEVVK